MKERPIFFSGPMIRAIFEGRKTQTRRVVKFPVWFDEAYPHRGHASIVAELSCPHGVPGDRLWVREAFCYRFEAPGGPIAQPETFLYAAEQREVSPSTKWVPSIHMPRRASRINLEVVAVRVQRLQDISQDDAVAEGMPDTRGAWEEPGRPLLDTDLAGPRGAFRSLWDEINGSRKVNGKAIGWDENPWIWAITFKVLR